MCFSCDSKRNHIFDNEQDINKLISLIYELTMVKIKKHFGIFSVWLLIQWVLRKSNAQSIRVY